MRNSKKKIDISGGDGYSLAINLLEERLYNVMENKELGSISIIGLGLLGGSLGLAVNRVYPHLRRIGYSHRQVTRSRAMEAGVVDETFASVAQAVRDVDMVVLASPIGTFEQLMREMSGVLKEGSLVTDVGSTKVLPSRWARKILAGRVEFVGSHPMAGSEQRGVDFARADLFDDSYCIITPTKKSKKKTVKFLHRFWSELGMRVSEMGPAQHDRVLARISHLPHVLAMSLVNCSDSDQMLLCGKGFLDTTRIASGSPEVWRDILMGNASNTASAIGKLIKELTRSQKALEVENDKAILKLLTDAQTKRNELIEKKLKRKELLG